MITITGTLEDWVIKDVLANRKNESKKANKVFKMKQREEEFKLKAKIDKSRPPPPKAKTKSIIDYIPFGKAIVSFFSKPKKNAQ